MTNYGETELADHSQIILAYSVSLWKPAIVIPGVLPNFLETIKDSQGKLNQPLAPVSPKAKKLIKYFLKLCLSWPALYLRTCGPHGG